MNFKKNTENTRWALFALIPVGVVSLGYILFKRDFAKIYLELSFLNFPIFIGELLLAWCILLLTCRLLYRPLQFNKSYYFVFTYLAWLMFKVIQGYVCWGPLALRHAALFYYPLFFMIGFIFYNRDILTWNNRLLLFALDIFILSGDYYDQYWTLSLALLGAILILRAKDKKWVIFMSIALALAIPYVSLFRTARMMFVANTFSIIFLLIAIVWLFEIKTLLKALILTFVLLGILSGFYKYFILGESGRTFSSPRQIMESFKSVDKTVQEREKDFKIQPLKVKLFNQQCKLSHKCAAKSNFLNYQSFAHYKLSKNSSIGLNRPLAEIQGESLGNILFRLFIWRDMYEDWKVQKPIMGVDFGKPFLSQSLIALNWAQSEWGRDGWIEPHNSYFNILYRAGIVGILLVIVIWGAFIWFVALAFTQRSWILILLAAILLNWMVAANFLLIFEVAYTAIPFWTLAGMAGAYAFKR